MSTAKKLIAVVLLLGTVALAQRKDPLTAAETDQLRQVAQEPQKRLKLLIKFTEARLDSIDQLRSDAKQAQGRGNKIRGLLDDFTFLVDELDDNLDQYQSGRNVDKDSMKDYRKGLKEVVSAEGRFRARLRTLRHEIDTDAQTKTESRDYIFALQDAEDSLKSSLDTAQEYSKEKDEEKPAKK
jgi:chromosome segregation ATPase